MYGTRGGDEERVYSTFKRVAGGGQREMRILKEGAELGTAEKKLNNLLISCQNCVFEALITNSSLFLKTNG